MTRWLSISLFIVAALALAGLEVLSRRERSRIPRLGDVAGFVMRYRAGRLPVGRIALYGVWWWLGWHFFAR